MDLALAIEKIHYEAQYFGATDENTKEQFDALTWLDERKKPTWAEIQEGWVAYETTQQAEAETKAQAKAELLERLGITADEAKLLLA
jgi:hypothetical protein